MRLLSLIAPPLCISCLAPAGAGPFCRSCRLALVWLPAEQVRLEGVDVWAPLAYEGPARATVARLKSRAAPRLADQMAAPMVAGVHQAAVLVPVPGRTHALLLAQALGERAGCPVVRALERVPGPRQVGRTRSQRLRNPPRFRVLATGPSQAVVVDDVITTGATAGACARALRASGWKCAEALAYARTPVR